MSQERWRQWSSEPEQIDLNVTMTGTGNGTVPTKNFGRGVTLTWVSTGVIKMTLAENIGNFMGGAGGYSFQAISPATPSQLAGFSVVFGAFDSTGKIVNMNIFNGSLAAADLQVGQILSLQIPFKMAQSTL